jgi:hypothetical protein
MERKDLESLHTKTLISMLRYEIKHHGGDYDECEQIYDNGYNILQFRLTEYGGYSRNDVQKYKSWIEVKGWKFTSVLEFTYADEATIREILKTRPHIPSKKEMKEITRQMIIESRGKTKRNLKFAVK